MMNKFEEPKSLIEWLGFRSTPDWTKARTFGAGVGSLLLLASAFLFLSAIMAALFIIGRITFTDSALSFGSSTLIAALLGAPFVIWGTVLKHQTVAFQKEGHMTDRINKAIEQLGTEKAVERIGRPVTIWSGKVDRISYSADRALGFAKNKRTKLGEKEWDVSHNAQTDDVVEEYRITVSTWAEERTVIQWQEEPVELKSSEVVGSEGPWQVFKETQPNIEVRVGAILSMERIAQDSTRHDQGRDHVRIMEILCAYIRENSPVSLAKFGDFPSNNFGDVLEKKANIQPSSWIDELERPRSDIQLAITVIGRRSTAQIKVERHHNDGKSAGYTLDLSHTQLRKVDFERLDFSRARFFKSCMEGLYCQDADFSECNFRYANLTGANANRVNLSDAKLEAADLSYAILKESTLRNCELSHTHFVRSKLRNAEIQFLGNTGGTQVNRAYFNYSDLRGSLIQGDLMGVIFNFSKIGDDKTSADAKGIRFKNAKLGEEKNLLGQLHTEISYPEKLLSLAFGDSTVSLPNGLSRPEHWPRIELDISCFNKEWKKWLSNPAAYSPPHK